MKLLTILLTQADTVGGTLPTTETKYIGFGLLVSVAIIAGIFIYIHKSRLDKYPPGNGEIVPFTLIRPRPLPSKRLIRHVLVNKGIKKWRYARIAKCEHKPDKKSWHYQIEYYLQKAA